MMDIKPILVMRIPNKSEIFLRTVHLLASVGLELYLHDNPPVPLRPWTEGDILLFTA
jgi:hypothetical protein